MSARDLTEEPETTVAAPGAPAPTSPADDAELDAKLADLDAQLTQLNARLAERDAEPPPKPLPAKGLQPWVWVSGGAGLLLVLVALGWMLFGGGRTPEPASVCLTERGVKHPVRTAAIAPGGGLLAFADGKGLQILTIDTGERRSVPVPPGMIVEELTWTPDETTLWISARRRAGFAPSLWKVPLAGGEPREVSEDSRSPAVSPDGREIAFVHESTFGKSLWRLDAESSGVQKLIADEEHDYQYPTWSPDGRWIAFVRTSQNTLDAALMMLPTGGGRPIEVSFDFERRTAPCWSPDGQLLFGRRDNRGAHVWGVPIDLETGQAEDEPRKVLERRDVSHLEALSVSADGSRLVFVPVRTQVDVYVADLEAAEPFDSLRRLTRDDRDQWPVAWTPAGDSLLLNVETVGRAEVMLQPLQDGKARMLAEGLGRAVTSSGEILFTSTQGNTSRVLSLPDEDGEPRSISALPADAVPGRSVLRCASNTGGGCLVGLRERDVLQLHAFDPRRSGGKGRLLAKVGLSEREYGWNVSPNGSRVAVVNGGRTITLLSLRDSGIRRLTLAPSLYTQSVAWSHDGKSLWVSGLMLHSAGGYALYRVELSGRSRLVWRTNDRWFDEPVPSPDGRHLAVAARTIEADAWLLDHARLGS
jgi:Tol biopolymer transport system component